jgi:hypothetical protein
MFEFGAGPAYEKRTKTHAWQDGLPMRLLTSKIAAMVRFTLHLVKQLYSPAALCCVRPRYASASRVSAPQIARILNFVPQAVRRIAIVTADRRSSWTKNRLFGQNGQTSN